MSADIVDIKAARMERANGNGAREAVSVALSYCFEPMGDVMTEAMLMKLWELGFKIVPVDEGEKA